MKEGVSSFLNMEISLLVSMRYFQCGVGDCVVVSNLDISRLFSWSSNGSILNIGLKSIVGRVLANFNS